MPVTHPSASSTAWRFFGVLSLVLLLAMGYQVYQAGGLVPAIERVTNNYRFFSTPPPAPPSVVVTPLPPRIIERQTIVYRTATLSPAQVASIRQALTLDITLQLRRELARQAPKPATVTLKQKPMVLALRDSVSITAKPGSNKLSMTTVKTGSFQDKWLTLNTVVKPGKAGRPDSAEISYQIRNEYDVAAWVKRTKRWPFGKRRIYVTLTSRNPNAKDAGLDAIPVKKATKKR